MTPDTQITKAGRKLREWRKAQEPKVTLAELGERVGYSAMSMSRFERGLADPPLDLIRALARVGIAEAGDWIERAPAEGAPDASESATSSSGAVGQRVSA